jgi:rubrerythrin
MPKSFHDLSEKEILALAISLEEEDGRIYGEFVERMRPTYPKTAESLEAMREEESGHRSPLHRQERRLDASSLTEVPESCGFLELEPKARVQERNERSGRGRRC